MKYRIAHITDLMLIPPEHWEECVRDLRGSVPSLHLVKAMAAITPGADFDAAKHCPYVDFVPDGKGVITPMVNGVPLFTMTAEGDDTAALRKQVAGLAALLREVRAGQPSWHQIAIRIDAALAEHAEGKQ